MANSSGFVDFNQYSDLNRDEETRMLEEAMARAEAAQANAEGKLRRSGREAAGRYGADGQYAGEAANISETASYGDYLSAKGEAAAAWAAVTAQSRNPYAQALRGSIRAERGIGGDGGAGDRLGAMEDKYGAEVTTRRAGQERMRGEAAAAAEAKKKAKEERDAFDQGNKDAFNADLRARGARLWQGRDQRATGSYGSPFAPSTGWTNTERGDAEELARLARQNGAYDAWGAQGMWDEDVEYGPGGARNADRPGRGNIGLTAGGGEVKYGDPNESFLTRRGGFKGWGK